MIYKLTDDERYQLDAISGVGRHGPAMTATQPQEGNMADAVTESLLALVRVRAYMDQFDGWPDYHEIDGTSGDDGNYLALTLGDLRAVIAAVREVQP